MKTVRSQCDSMQDSSINCSSAMSSAQLRKINKPIVEKKRRERINVCLDELKDLLMQTASKQEQATQSKLEKADILEMTVRHLRHVRQQQQQQQQQLTNTPSNSNDNNSADTASSSYREGYSDCAREVATYLGRLDSAGIVLRTRVLAHLSARLRAVNSPQFARGRSGGNTAMTSLSSASNSTHRVRPYSAVGWSRVSGDVSAAAAAAAGATPVEFLSNYPNNFAVRPTDVAPQFSFPVPVASSGSYSPPLTSSSPRCSTPIGNSSLLPEVAVTSSSAPTYDVNGNIACNSSNDGVKAERQIASSEDEEDSESSLVWRPW